MNRNMKCAEVSRRLGVYADGELDPQGVLAVEAHLQDCSRCRAALAGTVALRDAIVRACEPDEAPDRLRKAVEAQVAEAPVRYRATSAGGWLAAAPGCLALLIAGWLALAQPWSTHAADWAAQARVVYHIAGSDDVAANLRTVKNHLDASPGLRAVVVAHSDGIKFLLRGATDAEGRSYEPVLRDLRERGVEFRVCTNTLTRNRIDLRTVVPEAVLVPSGIAEISRLQKREGYTYLRL